MSRTSVSDRVSSSGTARPGPLPHRRWDILACLLLFVVAWSLRSTFQQASATDVPLRADAGKYYRAAYNLRVHGVHSLEPPSDSRPETRTDLPPGYPGLLALVMPENHAPRILVERVRTVQVLLGAATVVLTYLLARTVLSGRWAAVAAFLVAVNPHLIALEHYVLTETLFTAAVMLGVVVATLSWRSDSHWLTLLASLVLAASAQVRAVAYLLPIALAPAYLLAPLGGLRKRRHAACHIAMCLAGFLGMIGVCKAFERAAVLNDPEIDRRPEKYVVLRGPLVYLADTLRPPTFLVAGESHILARNGDQEWKYRTTASFADAPLAYMNWNLWGRWYWMWHFDNAYNGDVYVYPMRRKGFEEQPALRVVHRSMRLLHWPLYLLSLLAPVVLGAALVRRALPIRYRPLLIPALAFLYLLAVVSVLSWLPRYSIPARPLSYVLGASLLSYLAYRVARRQCVKLCPEVPTEPRAAPLPGIVQ